MMTDKQALQDLLSWLQAQNDFNKEHALHPVFEQGSTVEECIQVLEESLASSHWNDSLRMTAIRSAETAWQTLPGYKTTPKTFRFDVAAKEVDFWYKRFAAGQEIEFQRIFQRTLVELILSAKE